MLRIKLVSTLSLLVVVGTALADAPPRKIASVEGITEYDLDNGLRVLLFPDDSQSKVTVNMTVLVGSRQEGYGETGMAHLLEHMVFKGTPRHPHIPNPFRSMAPNSTAAPRATALTTSKRWLPATRTSSLRWTWNRTEWSTAPSSGKTSTRK